MLFLLPQSAVLVAALCFVQGTLAVVEPNPCLTKTCNSASEVCREVETCNRRQQCVRTAVCLSAQESQFFSGGCMFGGGEPLLELKNDSSFGLRTCYTRRNCDEGFYCSTELMDVASRCCRANPAPTVNSGSCPTLEARESFWCVDECRSDADCHGSMKCCQKSLSCARKECTTPDACSLKNCPRGTRCGLDPHYNAHCLPIPISPPETPPVTSRPSPPSMPSPIIRVRLAQCPNELVPIDWSTDCAPDNVCDPANPRSCGLHKKCCRSYYCDSFICRTPVPRRPRIRNW